MFETAESTTAPTMYNKNKYVANFHFCCCFKWKSNGKNRTHSCIRVFANINIQKELNFISFHFNFTKLLTRSKKWMNSKYNTIPIEYNFKTNNEKKGGLTIKQAAKKNLWRIYQPIQIYTRDHSLTCLVLSFLALPCRALFCLILIEIEKLYWCVQMCMFIFRLYLIVYLKTNFYVYKLLKRLKWVSWALGAKSAAALISPKLIRHNFYWAPWTVIAGPPFLFAGCWNIIFGNVLTSRCG